MILHFLENPLELNRLGNERYRKFVNTHINFLKANNVSGALTVFINLLENSFTPFEKWLNDQDLATSTRTGKTGSVDSILKDFEEFMDEVWDEVNYKFAKKEPKVFINCFPNGKSEYNKITRTNAPLLIKRVADFCATHSASLPAPIVAEAAEFDLSYNEERDEQQEEIGGVKEGSTDGKQLRAEVALNMKIVLLNLLIINIKKQEVVLDYYDAEEINYNVRRNKASKNIPPAKA
jgi:hypothetical protein